uniref:Odorant Binding Protein 21 n=1 Tax=Dendrolimus punctatus TaxID=238572 RepID=A0A2K8GKN1_9NEOP|nr:Odorant Binding Protein 21 [Dendrolimus punctatus]
MDVPMYPEVTFRVEVYRKVYQAMFKCMNETGVRPEDIQLIRDGTYDEGPAFKKFIYCNYVTSGYATEDGEMKIDDIANEFPPEYNMITILKNCVTTDSDPVEKLFNSFKCYQKTSTVRMGF